MWYVKHSHSDIRNRHGARHLALGLLAVLGVLLPTLPVFGALITTDRYIVRDEEPVTEDQYVTSTAAVVEGTINGDLTVFTGSLTISGTVTGNVTVFSAGSVSVEDSGSIGGSLNGAATNVSVRGNVGSDIFIAAGSTVVEGSGSVGRDVMGFGGTVRVDGSVGRDVRGRSYRTTVDGTVAGDVDVATQSLGISSTAVIGGDVLYRSASEASISDGATIGGTVTQLPAQSNFVYGIVLAIANIVGFLGFIVAGLVIVWLARSTGSRAVGSVLTKPLRSFLVGVATVIVLPVLVGLLAFTLVGIPLAIILVAIGAVLFIVGAVPVVTALGHLILVKRGGLFGAFLVGAVLWRLSIFIPWVGPFLFLLALVWGVGAWVLGVLAARRSDPLPPALVPAALVARGERTPDWEPPLAPGAAAVERSEPSDEIDDEIDIEPTNDVPPPDAGPGDTDEVLGLAPEVGEDDGQTTEDDEPLSSAVIEEEDDEVEPPSPVSGEADMVGDRVVFGSAVAATVAGADASDSAAEEAHAEEPVVGDKSVPEAAAEHTGSGEPGEPNGEDLSGLSLSERFTALREELLTGTVEPAEQIEDEDNPDDDGPPSNDWGLKG